MELSGTYTFDAPQEMVWEALNNPHVLTVIVPGAQGFHQRRPSEYSGLLKVEIGPVKGTLMGTIKVTNASPPDSYSLHINGHGSIGVAEIDGEMALTTLEETGQTEMQYSGRAQVGGRIASSGQRLIETVAKTLINQSFDSLNNYLTVQLERQR